jgi:hypothetical protein
MFGCSEFSWGWYLVKMLYRREVGALTGMFVVFSRSFGIRDRSRAQTSLKLEVEGISDTAGLCY